MTDQKKLSDEDMARVSEYLNSPVHQVERAAFRPGVLLLVLTVVTTLMTLVSMYYAWSKGAITFTGF